MKILWLWLLIFLSASISGISQVNKSALFLGNSYTYVNDLPQILADMAISTGDVLTFDSNTPGGHTLNGHSTNSISLEKVMQGTWDFVILQEQSQLPSFPINQVESEVFPYATLLDELINLHNPCAETLFYRTWGRKNGDASNCAIWPPVCTYAGMDSLLHARYLMMAEMNNAAISPVGQVWKQVRAQYPSIELYASDQSHPSVAGSYAAACSFYACIFRKDPMLITYDMNLDPLMAMQLRQVAKTIVFDDLDDWSIGSYDPIASFDMAAAGALNIAFENASSNATGYAWDFGDGMTSSEENPLHAYASAGNYEVTLIASHCSYSDTLAMTIEVLPTGLTPLNSENTISVFPNPSSNELRVGNIDVEEVVLIDMLGRSIRPYFKKEEEQTIIALHDLNAGVYLLRVYAQGAYTELRILKE